MDRLTARHRQAQHLLRLATVRDLLKLWPALDVQRLDRTYPAWASAVSALVDRNQRTSAGLAAAYIRAFRAQEIGLEQFTPTLAEPVAAEQVQTVLRVTSVVSIKQAMLRGDKLAKAMDKAFVLSSGEASRLVLDGGRRTILDSIRDDPKASGWQRVTDGNACGFCRMLAGRGFVYKAETVHFASHGHCGCSAVPEYGEPQTVRDYVPTTRAISDVDRARVRDWLAKHPDA